MNRKAQNLVILIVILLPVILGIIFLTRSGRSSGIGNFSLQKLAVIRVEGVIEESGWYVQLLRDFRQDNSVAGVLLRVDSPGGAVAPSQEIYSEITAYKAAGKPLVVSMGNMAASGGYYIASPAERIFASPGTLTGSIGVIFTVPLYEELTQKLGVEFRIFKAGEFKDIGSPYRNHSEQEKQLFQRLLDDTHEQFIQAVCKGRGLDEELVRSVADGRIFTGKQAYEQKLVDTLGGFEDALQYLRAKSGVSENSKIIEKEQRGGSWWDMITQAAKKEIPALGSFSKPTGLYFLFQP
ncbi:MAG: signal peptide peptidase SppA [Chitinispirillaceae bacterium]